MRQTFLMQELCYQNLIERKTEAGLTTSWAQLDITWHYLIYRRHRRSWSTSSEGLYVDKTVSCAGDNLQPYSQKLLHI